MSNLIKSNFIYVKQNKKIINHDDSFQLLREIPVVGEREEAFVDGLNVVNMEKLIKEEEALIENKAAKLLEDANRRANEIINNAKAEAGQIKELAIEEGKKLGYVKGFESGSEEIKKIEASMQEKLKKQDQDYEQLLLELEPKFVEVMANLIEKITSVVVEDKKDVLLHLMHRAITNVEKSKTFLVHVSKEDYEFVVMNRERVLSLLSEGTDLQIMEDLTLEKNQCLIETNGQFIDCSLDIQLKNLITDLKMLVKI